MTRSDRERRDAERAARRANRLAQRAEQRALRKEEQAQLAVERAERLAERANRRPGRQKPLDESIEDESITDRDIDMDEEFEQEQPRRRSPRAERRSSKKRWKYGDNWDSRKWRFKTVYGRRAGNLYRDKRNKKICGVCAGTADYLGMETWKIRLLAVMGLIFIPSVAITVYFITYFLMDDKPYYRQVTDRFDDDKADYDEEPRPTKRSRRTRKSERPEASSVEVPAEVSNTEAMRKAKDKFMDIEDRLRSMETHVTSSTFELQRELKKISGDEV